MTRVELHIERLLLEGVEPQDAQATGAALQAELQQQLSAALLPDTLRTRSTRAVVDGGAIELSASAPPRVLGAAVANAVHKGLTK
jgi:hypothetical protein